MHVRSNQHACLQAAVICVLIFGTVCKVEESLLRQLRTPEGGTTNILSDGKVIVVTLIDSSGFLQECTVIKDNTTIARQLFKDVVTSSGQDGLRYQMLDVDVRKYGRKCRKYIRDVKRKKEISRSEAERKFLNRLKLDETVPDTKWCTRQTRSRYLKGLGKKTTLDTCCREFHSNSDVIPAFTFRHHYLNALPWPITSCESSRRFQKCLQDEGSVDSTTIKELYFDLLKLPCYELEERIFCAEHEQWYDKCKTKKTVHVAVERSFNKVI